MTDPPAAASAGAQLARIRRAMLERRALSGVAELLGVEIVEVEPGRVRLRFAVKPEFMHLGGAVQGGLVTAYADMAMATAAHTLCDEGELLSTTQLSISFLAPVHAGPVYGEGRVVLRGRTTIFLGVRRHRRARGRDGAGHLGRFHPEAQARGVVFETAGP